MAKCPHHGTVSLMTTFTPSHRLRGFSLNELVIVFVALSALTLVGWWGWSQLTTEADKTRPLTQLEVVQVLQQSTILTRGAFIDSPTTMQTVEPGYTFVAGNTPATALDGVNSVSISAVISEGEAVAYAAALSDSGVCYGVRIPDPRSNNQLVHVTQPPTPGVACSADTIAEVTVTP